MQTYLVGGAVRDKLLGQKIKDKDYVVVGATSAEMIAEGFTPVGADFPVFLHPESRAEYALARTERKSGHGYQGFTFRTETSVTLEEDLLRRDLTINAMAQDDSGHIIDPYGGQADIKNKTLRHVSSAFSEDPLRVLRVARFYARFYLLGFSVADETKALMRELSDSGELNQLTPERVWIETEKALNTERPDKYIALLHEVGALKTIMPEVDALYGVPQPPKYHPEIDTGIHSELVLYQAAKRSQRVDIRFAALMHDLGKALTDPDKWPSHHGHERLGVKPVNVLCQRLKIPSKVKRFALLVTEFHGIAHQAFELKPSTLWQLFKNIGAIRSSEALENFLICCIADSCGRTGFEERPYPQAKYLRTCAEAVSQIKPSELITQGFEGAALGKAIKKAQIRAIKEVKEIYPVEQWS